MSRSAAARPASRPSPLITLTAALGFLAAGLSPAFAGPLALQDTAIGSADGAIETIAKWGSADGAVFQAAAVDLNGDGQPEWIVRVEHMYQCRAEPRVCRTYVMRRADSGGWDGIAYPYSRAVTVLESQTNGYRDLQFDRAVYQFDGSDYREGATPAVDPAPTPEPPAVTAEAPAVSPGWQPIRFHGFTAQVPSGWQQVEDSDEQVMFFTGDLETHIGAGIGLAFVPEDEIVPRDATVTAERAVTLAGRPFIRRELTLDDGTLGPNARMILLASQSPVAGERYLLVFGAALGVNLDDYRAMFEQAFASVQAGQASAPAPVPAPAPAPAAEPKPIPEGKPAPQPMPPNATAPTPPNKAGGKLGTKVPPAGGLTPAPQPAPEPVVDEPAEAGLGLEILDVPAAPPPELDLAGVPAAEVAPAAPPPELSWTPYVNPRFGFRIDLPQGLFLPKPPPENGDGQAFVAIDDGSRFRVWGSNNVLAETAESAMDSFAAPFAPGAIRSSRMTGAGGFETEALRGGTLVFHREIVTPDVIFGFEAELDNPDDTATAEIFRAMMESLRGPEDSAAEAEPASRNDAVVAASLAVIEPALGQAVALRVETLRELGDWAYLAGVPTRPDGSPLDWLSTPFARDWQADAMSDLVMVLLVQEAGNWRVVDHVIGPTDVYWLGWVAQYGLPETLFYEP